MLTRRTLLAASGVALAALLGAVSITCADGAWNYVEPGTVMLERVLPPPPAAGSAAERAELDAMLRIQAARTPAQAERAKVDADVSIFRLADALGSPAEFNEKRLPRTTSLFQRITEAETAVVRPAKQSFARQRPFEIEAKLKPIIGLTGSLSYPSGHATWAFAAGLVLADMIPEKRAEILARAEEFAENRVVAGVHYPSDVDAGRVSGSVLAAFLFASPVFRADEKVATAELRAALKLTSLH